MSDYQHNASNGSARERELEIEVARLQAEIDALRGDDPTAATSRFLAMAAATVDQAVEDARREADEIVEEISAEAEARRDEATRVAAEAEAMAEQMLADADRAQERIDEATAEAEAITAAAEETAEQLVEAERRKAAAEAESLAEVRAALDTERAALETYHEGLQQKVQELAESMVSFMSSELPSGAAAAIGGLEVPQLASVLADDEQDAETELDAATDLEDVVEPDATEIDDEIADEAEAEIAEDDESVLAEATELDVDAEDDAGSEPAAVGDIDPSADPFDAIPEIPDAPATDDWTQMLESAIPADEAYPDAMEMPADAIDEVPAGPPSTFAEHEILESTIDEEAAKPSSAGLFSRATADDDDGFADLAEDDPEEKSSPGLFGMLGARLVKQTDTAELAEALDENEGEDDEAFSEFLAGDDGPDPSRDWLLKPDQG